MEVRESLLNLVITCVLVLVVALVALFLRNHKSAPMAIPVAVASPVAEAVISSNSAANPAAVAHKVEARFRSFPNAKLIPAANNEADTLRIQVGGEEQVFTLYFVDAIDASLTNTQQVEAQARFFGGTTREITLACGRAALNYVQTLLQDRPFLVQTRWEKVPNLDRYYALIQVEYEPGKRAYLADLLVKGGYARLGSLSTPLPDDKRTPTSYALELNGHAKYAREHRLGIWSMVK